MWGTVTHISQNDTWPLRLYVELSWHFIQTLDLSVDVQTQKGQTMPAGYTEHNFTSRDAETFMAALGRQAAAFLTHDDSKNQTSGLDPRPAS